MLSDTMAPAESDPFQILSEENVSGLIEALHKNLPDSYHALCFAMNIRDWLKMTPDLDAGIYAPKGDYSDSTFLVILKFNGESMGTYYSQTEEGCARLKEALRTTQLLRNADTISLLISAVHDRIHRLVGTDWCSFQLDEITPCNLFSLTHDDTAKLNPKCPEDVEIRRLKEEDAELVNSLWPHRSDRSIYLVKENIMMFPCFGVYRRQDNKLLSWVLKWFYGGIGVLQTVHDAKRKGYAQIVLKALADHLVSEDWPIHATVLVGNHESTPLFEKMGFTRQFLCHYIEFICQPSNSSS